MLRDTSRSILNMLPVRPRFHKRADPFYLTPAWRALRIVILKRDGFRCVICKADVSAKGAARVDHIKPRSTHPDLAMTHSNLRTLCSTCDSQAHRERTRGPTLQRDERFVIGGIDAVTGLPRDPNHPWNRKA